MFRISSTAAGLDYIISTRVELERCFERVSSCFLFCYAHVYGALIKTRVVQPIIAMACSKSARQAFRAESIYEAGGFPTGSDCTAVVVRIAAEGVREIVSGEPNH